MENLEEKFKINLHYGGNFTSDYRGYENGLVQYVHRCDPDTFSYFELKDVVVSKLKYNNVKSMYYVRPGETLQQGLHKLYWGNEMCEMVRLALANNNRIEVYVEHGIDTPSLVVNNQEDGSSEEDGSEDDGYSEEDENSEDDSEDSDFSEEASDDSSSEEDDENVPIRSKNKTTPKVSHGKKKSEDSEPSLKHTDFVEILDSDIEIDEYDIDNESDEELREIRRKKIDMKKGKAKMPDSSTANASGANAGSSNPPSQPQRGPCSSSQPRQFTDEKMQDVELEMNADNSEEYKDEIPEENDDGDSTEAASQFKFFNPKTDMNNIHLFIGLQFAKADDFRKAVRKYGVDNRIDILMVRNEGWRFEVACNNSKACPWRMWASKVGKEKTVSIKNFNNVHMCGKAVRARQLNYRFLAKRYSDRIMKNPYWKLREMKAEFQTTFEMDVSIGACARTKRKALLR